jgi:hypothetical protein
MICFAKEYQNLSLDMSKADVPILPQAVAKLANADLLQSIL